MKLAQVLVLIIVIAVVCAGAFDVKALGQVLVGSGSLDGKEAAQVKVFVAESYAFTKEAAEFKLQQLDKETFVSATLKLLTTDSIIGRGVMLRPTVWTDAMHSRLEGRVDDEDLAALRASIPGVLDGAQDEEIYLVCEEARNDVYLASSRHLRIPVVTDAATRSKRLCAAVISVILETVDFEFHVDALLSRIPDPPAALSKHCTGKNVYVLDCHARYCQLSHADGMLLTTTNRSKTVFAVGFQAATNIAFDVCCGSVTQGPDFVCLTEKFLDGNVQLEYRGNLRDGKVLQFYLQAELDLRAKHDNVVIQTKADDVSPFESFGFQSAHELLQALRTDWDEADRMLQSLVVYKTASLTLQERKVLDETASLRPLRLGVAGATSSGKSTLVNALLRRDLSPMMLRVCTGTIVEFVYLPNEPETSPAKITVQFMPLFELRRVQQAEEQELQLLQSNLASLNDSVNSDMIKLLGVKISDRHRRLEALHQAASELQEKEFSIELEMTSARMARYSSVADGNRLPEFVSRVVVAVPNPLLAHMTVVDTPGTQDISERRAGIARRTLQSLHAWLYLVDASETLKPSTVSDLTQLHLSGRPGMLMLSKVNMMFDQIKEDEYEIELARKQSEYAEFTNGTSPIPAVNAKGYWEAIRLGSITERKAREAAHKQLLKSSYGATHLGFVAPHMHGDLDDLLKRVLKDAENDAAAQQLAEDVFLESSGLAQLLTEMQTFLFHREAVPRYRKGASAILQLLQTRIDGVTEIVHGFEAFFRRHNADSGASLTADQIEQEKLRVQLDIWVARDVQKSARAEHQRLASKFDELTQEAAKFAQELSFANRMASAQKQFEHEARQQYGGSHVLFGFINVNMYPMFDVLWARDLFRQIEVMVSQWTSKTNFQGNMRQVVADRFLAVLQQCAQGSCLLDGFSHEIRRFWCIILNPRDEFIGGLLRETNATMPTRALEITRNVDHLLLFNLRRALNDTIIDQEHRDNDAVKQHEVSLELLETQEQYPLLVQELKRLKRLHQRLSLKFQEQLEKLMSARVRIAPSRTAASVYDDPGEL